MIVKSSVTLGALPEARGVSRCNVTHFLSRLTYGTKVTSWLPMHAVSNTILDVAFANEEPSIAMNLVHPRPVSWASLMQPVSEAMYQKGLTPSPLPLVRFAEWVERLEKYAVDANEENVRRVVSCPSGIVLTMIGR